MKIIKLIIKRDPIFITLVYIGFIWIILIGTILLGARSIHKTYSIISLILTIILTSVPIIITFYHISTYKETLSSFIRLFSLMVQIVLLFGTIYFVMQTMTAEEKHKAGHEFTVNQKTYPLNNVSTLWYYEIFKNKPDKLKILYNALLAYQDCIHFSLVTSSTVGYGDIVPKDPLAKLIVDIQIALSFVIVAFGIGVFISSRSKVSHERKLLGIAKHIEENLSGASDEQLKEWDKYLEFILLKINNLKKKIKNEQRKREEKSRKP